MKAKEYFENKNYLYFQSMTFPIHFIRENLIFIKKKNLFSFFFPFFITRLPLFENVQFNRMFNPIINPTYTRRWWNYNQFHGLPPSLSIHANQTCPELKTINLDHPKRPPLGMNTLSQWDAPGLWGPIPNIAQLDNNGRWSADDPRDNSGKGGTGKQDETNGG